jgi:site-specific DNA-methyltransferase (adenine-specific)
MSGARHTVGRGFHFYRGDSLDVYAGWPAPHAIVSDGAYGVRGFDGDTAGVGDLVGWYRPHLEAWGKAARPSTTLWLWNTEIGWATLHPAIERGGWAYVQTVVWDKGVGHIAGNVNGATIRQFPVVTEICAMYRREPSFPSVSGPLGAKEWLRHEWGRSGLPLTEANDACGVASAATRKYLTRDRLWYWPPGDMVARMAARCEDRGRPHGRPYFSLDGERPVTATEWDSLRHPWRHAHGLTNVWSLGPLSGAERIRGEGRAAPRSTSRSGASALHLNQKPLELLRRIVSASTVEGDVVWEPFGGLASASVAAVSLGRHACAAETDPRFQGIAYGRLAAEAGAAAGRRETVRLP